jgi:hypothetical protein
MTMAEREPSFSRSLPGDDPWDVRVETTLTPSVFEDLITLYRKTGYKTRQEWLRWLIVRELYGSVGEQRLKAGLDPKQPEDER